MHIFTSFSAWLAISAIAVVLMAGSYFFSAFHAKQGETAPESRSYPNTEVQTGSHLSPTPTGASAPAGIAAPVLGQGPGLATSTATTVQPGQMPTAIPLATPRAVPLGLPTTEEEYRKLKEEAAKAVVPTPSNAIRDDQ